MHFPHLFEFLELLQKNNSKDWMDENRKYYHEIRDSHIAWLEQMSLKIAEVDNVYTPTTGKKSNQQNQQQLNVSSQQAGI